MFVKTREFRITAPALLFDPALYPFDFAPREGLTKFLVVDESILELSPFVDVRFEPLAKANFWVDTRDLFALESARDVQRPRPAFIFHHSFACSTLLARCLGRIEAFFSLKEPWILRRLADHKRARGNPETGPQWRDMFCNYAGLLCRNFATGRMPVVKATNVANNLLVDVFRFLPDSPVLYLYSDLESFLASNLKKSPDTQRKIPGLAQEFLGDSDFLRRFPMMRDLSQLTFLQVCALTWLVNLYNLRESMGQHPRARASTLDVQDFLGDLPRSLGSVSRHFGHAPSAGDVQRMTDSQVLGTNAKDQSKPYGVEQRRVELNEIRTRHDAELKDAMAWIDPLTKELEILDFMRGHRLVA